MLVSGIAISASNAFAELTAIRKILGIWQQWRDTFYAFLSKLKSDMKI